MRLSSFEILGIFLGASAGLGIFLIVSSKLWPKKERVERVLAPSKFSRGLNETALQLGMKPSVLLALIVVLAVIGGPLAWAITGVAVLSLVLAFTAGALPLMFAAGRRAAARKALRNQWPDVVDALISAIRSGANIPDAVISLAGFSARAISTPAALFAQDYKVSGNFELAVMDLKVRWANPNGDRIIETLRLGRELGGTEITTVLASLGSHLRAESALRQEVEARQGWIRLAARIGVMAPWIVLVLLSTRSEAAQAYNSAAGIIMILIGLGVSMLAYRIMSAVGYLPEEKRWLA
jgi:tight adherence protein B